MILEPLTEKDGFLSRYVEDEKKNKLDQLNAEKNNKPSYALSRCFSLLCRGEPYDYPASRLRKELPSVSAHSLLEFYRKMLCRAPIEIFYFGEEDLNSLCSDLMNHLSPLFTPKLPLVSDVISFPKPQVCREEERLAANQSTLCLGFKTCVRMGMPGFYALFLLKEIFCDSPVSLLFTNLREKESLCYYCQGSLLSRKGVYLLEFGIDGKDAEKIEKETLAQLEALKTGNFDEEFLFLCKKSLCDGFAEFYDNPAEIEGWYLRQVLAGSALSPKDVSKKIFNMHKKDVQRVANTLILDSVFLLYGTKNSKEEKTL